MLKYDVVIIGSGPNGLTTAAYLSKAALKVLLLERRLEAGGGLATEEVTIPGFLHNTHSVYHMMVDYAPPYGDLELEERHGCKYVYPPLQFVMPLRDGQAVFLHTDVERTCRSLAEFSTHDADSYRQMYYRFQKYMDDFLAPATYVKAIPTLEQVAMLQRSEIGKEIMELSEKSPKTIVDELFEDEHVRALMLCVACFWGLEYDMEGLGYMAALTLNRATHYQLCVGGSHVVAQALQKVILENGGMIWGSQRIKRIVVSDNRAVGVELDDGRMVEAHKAVVSSIDPYQTFFSLVGEAKLSQDFAERLRDYRWEKWSLFTVHLALEEAPNFLSAAPGPESNRAFVYVLGCETTEELIDHWKAIEAGEVQAGVGLMCSFSSVHDASQAPPGKHTGTMSQMAPYKLKEGSDQWYSLKFKEAQAQSCLSTLQRYAPNLTDEKILWKSVSTPVDIENRFADMVQGSIKQGAYLPLQMGYNRPNEYCSQNRTPIENLYLCGASCYPGGLVTFGPGYGAANTIAEDLGVAKWWTEPGLVTKARQQGLL